MAIISLTGRRLCMGNFNEKSNAIKKAQIILNQCREREIRSKNRIRENLIQKNFINGHNERRVKEIYERQKRKIRFWKNISIIVFSLFVVALIF